MAEMAIKKERDWMRPGSGPFIILILLSIVASGLLIAFLPAPYQFVGIATFPSILIVLLSAEYPLLPLSVIVFFLPMNSLVESDSVSLVKVLAMVGLFSLLLSIGLSKGREKIQDCHQYIPLAFYMTAAVISTFFTVDMGRSTWALKKYATMMLLFFLVVNIVRKERVFKFIINLFLFSTTISCFYSLYSFALGTNLVSQSTRVDKFILSSGSERVWGLLGASPNQWGGFVVATMGFMIVFFFGAKNVWKKIWFFFLTIVYAITVVSTYSRMAFLGMIIVFVISGWKFRDMIPWKKLIFASVLIVFAWFLLPADYRERMTGMTTTQVVEEDPSTKRRIGYYFIGWEVFKERPLIGMGPKTFASIYGRPKYADYALLEKTSFGGRNEHSSYLHVLVGLGSLGLIIIFWFYLSVVRDVIKAEKYLEALGEKWSETWQIAVGFEILYYSYMFLAFFMDMLFDKHFWFWMAMGVVAYKITRDKFVQSINSRVVVEPGRSL